MTKDEIERIDALYHAATQGVWGGIPKRLYLNGAAGPVMSYLVGDANSIEGQKVSLGSERIADHQLVAALVNAWPALREAAIAVGLDTVE